MKDIARKVELLLQKTHENFLKVGAHFAAKGDLLMLEEILRQKPHWLNHRGSHGRTMLWEAVYHGKIGSMQYLLDRGAEIEAPGCHFSEHLVEISPLCLARHKGNTAAEKILLRYGAKYDIYSAAFLGDESTFRQKLEENPEVLDCIHPLAWTEEKTALIFYAVVGGNYEILQLMGEKGVQIKPDSHWLLKFAYWKKDFRLMELLVKYGADPKALIISDPLEKEAYAKLSALGFEIDINRPDKMGWPPIVYASRGDNGEHPEEIQKLIDAGADIEAVNAKGKTALHTAAKAGFSNVIKVLLEHGANLESRDMQEETPLFSAFRSSIRKQDKLVECMNLLIAQGADLEAKNKKGRSAKEVLHARKDAAELLEKLKGIN
ncbi:MAG: ankyrin repeat domain-containing protein [Bacteroidota bacterium]